MTAANGNNLDIIGAIALRLSDSTSQGGIETRQIVYICRDTSDFFLSRGACVELGIVPPDFPNGCQKRQSTAEVSACNVTSESSMTATCDCPRRHPSPLPPKDLPFPAVEDSRKAVIIGCRCSRMCKCGSDSSVNIWRAVTTCLHQHAACKQCFSLLCG